MRIEIEDVNQLATQITIEDLAALAGAITVEDVAGCPAETIVVQEAGIVGPQGLPGDLSTTTFVPPLTYDAPTYTAKIVEGTTSGQVLKWDGSSWVASNAPPRRVEYRTITAGEAAAKELTLAYALNEPQEILFDVANGGGPQFPDVDFECVGNTIRWAGLALDGLMDEGDRVRLVYQ